MRAEKLPECGSALICSRDLGRILGNDSSDMKNQVLLGRKFLRGRFVVDVALKNLLG